MNKLLIQYYFQIILMFVAGDKLLAKGLNETNFGFKTNNDQLIQNPLQKKEAASDHVTSGFSVSGYLEHGEEDQLDSSVDTSLCTKEVLMTFFPQPVVKAILIRHGISESEANKIAKELSSKDPQVIKLVESKASAMDPNPLNDVNQRDTAVRIFSDTLYEVFSNVLKAHNVEASDNDIQTILDDTKEVKGKLFVECIKKEHSMKSK
jgi:hypothetical protein